MAVSLEIGKFKFAIGKKRPNQIERGGTGSSVWSGIFSDEYLTELSSSSKKVTVYEKMRSSDGMVKAVLMAIDLSIRSAEWYIEGGDDVHEDTVGFVQEALFERMSISFDDFLHHALGMLPFGWSMFEKVFKFEDGRHWWKKIAPRLQKSLYKWKLDENGGLSGMTQWVRKNERHQYIDIDVPYLLVFSYMREGSNFEGVSLLRSAYKHWFIKDLLYKISGIGLERQAVGIPVGTLGENYNQPDKEALEAVVKDLRTNEESGVVLPPGFLLDILEGKLHARELLLHIEHHDRMIGRCALAEFLGLGGDGKTGSYSLSKDQSDFFMMCLQAICKNIAETMNRYAIPQLVDFNPFPAKRYPKLAFSIGKIDKEKLVEGIDKMVNRRVIIPEQPDEEYVRKLLGLPELEQEVIDERDAEEEEEWEREEDHFQQMIAVKKNGKRKFISYPTYKKPPKKRKKSRAARNRRIQQTIRLAEGKYWRSLTKWERGVKFRELDNKFTKAEKALVAELFGVSEVQTAALIKQIETVLTSGKLNDLYKITVRNRGTYAETLRRFMKDLADYGKGLAEGETGVAVESISNTLKNWLNVKADTIVEMHGARMKSNAMLTTLAGVNAGKTTKGILFDVKQGIGDYIDRELNATASVVVAESINQGRNEIVRSGEIQAAQYSAILDSRTCPLCRQLDGKVVDVEDPDFDRFTPPTHANCRCIWVYIKKEEEDVEIDWVAPSEETVDKYGRLVP